MSEIETLRLNANGLRFTARSLGRGPLILCLHGFPDSAHSFDDLLPVLAEAGYRAVAPFMRGYTPTQVPANADYSVPTLGRDALALADALGGRRFYIIGHDWGAAAAYAAAAYGPERVAGIVTAAVPPLRRFLFNTHPGQWKRSWYMGFFHLPWVADARVARDDCAFIDRLWQDWSPDWNYTAEDIRPVKAILSYAPSRRAALSYYRALVPALVSPRRRAERARMLGRMQVPGLVIAGSRDGCIGTEMFAGSEACFTEPAELRDMRAGHFMHREQPAQFANWVLEFLNSRSG